jgi:hypothetical protein
MRTRATSLAERSRALDAQEKNDEARVTNDEINPNA